MPKGIFNEKGAMQFPNPKWTLKDVSMKMKGQCSL